MFYKSNFKITTDQSLEDNKNFELNFKKANHEARNVENLEGFRIPNCNKREFVVCVTDVIRNICRAINARKKKELEHCGCARIQISQSLPKIFYPFNWVIRTPYLAHNGWLHIHKIRHLDYFFVVEKQEIHIRKTSSRL